jgi:hypothetical protein
MNEFSFWRENMTHDEMIRLSTQSSDSQELDQLSNSHYMLVRRAVARNRNTSSNTLNKLLFDKVKNVAFVASKHQNCTQIREFREENHPCIDCQKDEILMQKVCVNCETLNSFNTAS